MARKHEHYHKSVGNLHSIDVYRVITLWNVTDPCIQHALKKLLVAGGRGAGKSVDKDIQEAIDSLERWKEMRVEDRTGISDQTVFDTFRGMRHNLTLPQGDINGDAARRWLLELNEFAFNASYPNVEKADEDQAARERGASSLHFESDLALAEYLESLHECDSSGTVSNQKSAAAQAGARAIREHCASVVTVAGEAGPQQADPVVGFQSPDELASFLESLCCMWSPTSASDKKFPPAQLAARAIREAEALGIKAPQMNQVTLRLDHGVAVTGEVAVTFNDPSLHEQMRSGEAATAQGIDLVEVSSKTLSKMRAQMPQFERKEKPFELDPKDLVVDVYRVHGHGRNSADVAVRITHIPTRISVAEEGDRSRHMNKAIAMTRLKELVGSYTESQNGR